MTDSPERGGRRGLYLAAATTVVLAVTGVGVVVAGRSQSEPLAAPAAVTSSAAPSLSPASPKPTPSPSGAGTASATPTPSAEADFGPILPPSVPVSLDIPSIGVHSDRLVDLAYTKDGELEVPTDYDLPGWFSPGPTPGQFGPAVIAGHVDSKRRPAVFYRLRDLKAGATVTVGRKDGTTAKFIIDKVEQYPKNQFPTSKVYGNTTDRAELRLITCGGSFDEGTGHYRDNVVAYAHLTK